MEENTITVEKVRALLADRRMEIVSQGTGLHPNTIRGIRDGTTQHPSYNTMLLLIRYLSKGCGGNG